MTIKILYFGDIVGRLGFESVKMVLPDLLKQYEPDVILANVENVSHGRGINKYRYEELKNIGIEGMSSGDHVWHFREVNTILEAGDSILIRPANYPVAPGKGYLDLTVKSKRVRLINLIGRTFMNGSFDNPFAVAKEAIDIMPKPDVTVVDFHAEATSEKRALAEYIGQDVDLFVGTHTHVPTNDARMLENGCLYITDLGMNGPQDSIIGAKKEGIINSFVTGLPWHYEVAEGACEVGAICATIDLSDRKKNTIEIIRRIVEPTNQ